MISRRQLVQGLCAAPFLAAPASYGAAGKAGHIYSGARRDRQNLICGLGSDQTVKFEIPVESRAHGFARHPHEPLVVGFARRPGRYAMVFHGESGEVITRIHSPRNKHFYGHGVFSTDGRTLFATENDFAAGSGLIGVYDARAGFRRIGEFASGGIGPHEILWIPGTDTLVVANGGVQTHPDTGRTPHNLDTMEASLCYLDQGGTLLERHVIADWQKLSIRHLAVNSNGRVAIAMQYRGPKNHRPPLLATHVAGRAIELVNLPSPLLDRLNNYIGSIRFDCSGHNLVASAPRGGLFIATDQPGEHIVTEDCIDGCGVHSLNRSMLFSSGQGKLFETGPSLATRGDQRHFSELRFDNHLG